MKQNINEWFILPEDSRFATKYLLELLFKKIHPLISNIRNKISLFTEEESEIKVKIRDVYTLCSSQIKKCVLNLLEIFKVEYNQHTLLQDSRQCSLERLSWCCKRLVSVENFLDEKNEESPQDDSGNDSFNVTTMYFVNWIDHTFEVLNKLSEVIYKTDYKESETLHDQWKNDMVECVSGLHIAIDELLLSAMTLCRYCLPGDQHIVRARCQVVLRETKALLSELIEGDLSTTVKATSDSLKLPIMPSNINVMIDVLKDVLYILETNTNTALLALLIHCFSICQSPADILNDHFKKSDKGSCLCSIDGDNITEDCLFVKEFDLYNERLLQIGLFAVSCSSDQNRILSLRSGLASLEALDPHLVPALMTSPDRHHTVLLMNSWRQEVLEIRDSVFLIVDPVAFADKSKQMMHNGLLEVLKGECVSNVEVCSIINIGTVVYEFFDVYSKHEPNALTQYEKLLPLLADLKKVQTECKIVSNFLATDTDYIYDITMPQKKSVSPDQLIKRLKLLYTLVSRINGILHPGDNEDQFFESETCDNEPAVTCKNVTHTVYKNYNTYLNSPRKLNNMSRSIFARSTNVRSSTRNFPLAKLTKHLNVKKPSELSFSVQLEQMFNLSDKNENGNNGTFFVNKHLDHAREISVLYNFSPIKNRSSLRKEVLSKHYQLKFEKDSDTNIVEDSVTAEKESLMDETTSLQLTEVLNEMEDMTSMLSRCNETRIVNKSNTNILTLNINNRNTTVSKHIWNITVNTSEATNPVDESISTCTSNLTQPSNVTTMERINDLDFVETKLNSLKFQLETSL